MPTAQKLNGTLKAFIEKQPLFFVATADIDGRVNMSPKGLETLKIINNNRIIWLSLSGSGNETAAHVKATGRMTLMFCAFEGNPLILRVYGQARVFHPRDPEWDSMAANFAPMAGSRQIFDLDVDLIQTSCGSGVPIMEFRKSRGEEELVPYYAEMGPEGVEAYWRRKNVETIDGKPTGILKD